MATAKILPGNFIADTPKYEDDDGEDSLEDLKDRLDGRGEPPHNGGMEARLTALEAFAQDAKDRLVRLESKVDNNATKADLADASTSQVKWMVGTAVALGAAAITVMTFVLNNAVPKQPQQAPAVMQPSQQPPIIINVPASAPPASKK